jgi:hypothetical protein
MLYEPDTFFCRKKLCFVRNERPNIKSDVIQTKTTLCKCELCMKMSVFWDNNTVYCVIHVHCSITAAMRTLNHTQVVYISEKNILLPFRQNLC